MGILSSKWISKSPKAIFTNILAPLGPQVWASQPRRNSQVSLKAVVDTKSFQEIHFAGAQVAYQEGAREASLVWMAALLSCV